MDRLIDDEVARAETLAQKALSLDSESTTAYHLLAEAHMARRQLTSPWADRSSARDQSQRCC